MSKASKKIINFIKDHHVLALASVNEKKEPASCSVFYVFDEEELIFIFASDKKTEHMSNIAQNNSVSCAIHFETKEIGVIRGLQVKGQVSKGDKNAKKIYIKAFPYAKVMPNLQIWKITILTLKYTDNRLGFGKKVLWERTNNNLNGSVASPSDSLILSQGKEKHGH